MANGQIGKLDQRIIIQSKTLARAGAGGSTATWSNVTTTWAQVRPISGRERQNADRDEATSNYEVKIRYRSGIKEGDRIQWLGRHLNIKSVRREGPRDPYMVIDAELGAAA